MELLASVMRLSIESEVGGVTPTGKSFRFVRACARCPLPSENEAKT